MDKRSMGLLGTGLALVLFFAVNVLANATLRTVRLDLTEGKLFTLSDGSKSIAKNLDEPIRLYFFFSEGLAREIPQIKDYADRVRDVLDEFVLHSNGNLILEIIDPEPFSEEEERAVREGIFALPLPTGDSMYFGLVATNATDAREIHPYFDAFDAGKERFLEYDLSRMLYTLAHPDRNKVGILTSLPMAGGGPPSQFNPQPQPRWKILDHLDSFFETQMIEPMAEEIPEDIDVLVMVHPKDLPEPTLYAIDQYVLGGGKLVAFVDPHCEADQPPADPSNPMSRMGASRGSDLGVLFDAWGVELVGSKVVGDRINGMRVQYQSGGQLKTVPYVVWLGLGPEQLDQEDVVTSLLDRLFLEAAGVLRSRPEASTTFTPLIRSGEESMEIDVGMLQFMPDPEGLYRSFVPGFEALTLAARISGDAATAFPGGKPGSETDSEDEDGQDDTGEEEADGASVKLQEAIDSLGEDVTGIPDDGHLASNTSPINVIVVADADMLRDERWVEEQRIFNLSLGLRKTTDNADFLVNAIENLIGGEELISIRARGSYSRPFERVEEIRRDAEQRHLAEEQELERRVSEAERRINELQQEKSPDSALILSPEQQAELTSARKDMLDTKRKLRDVKHSLRKDIEGLGTKLKWINVGLIPLIVSGAAVALGAWRTRRRNK